MKAIPSEKFVTWNSPDKYGAIFSMTYTTYILTPEFKTEWFSELGVEIIHEIERYGYSVNLIKEFFSYPSLNENGKMKVVPTPDVLGMTAEDGKVVSFSRNAFRRIKRQISYYSKKSSDPQWLNLWKEKHSDRTLNIEPLYWPELLIHELSHVIVIEEKMADYVKRKEYEVKYNNEILSSGHNGSSPAYLVPQITALDHGRDFRTVYLSLCKKYDVKPSPKYAKMDLDAYRRVQK